jgi:PAS domain S-box-containing protein
MVREVVKSVCDHRKQVKEALPEIEEPFYAMFGQAADAIALIDAETGALVKFNERACENLGYTREELEKLKISGFDVIESADEVARHIRKMQGSA